MWIKKIFMPKDTSNNTKGKAVKDYVDFELSKLHSLEFNAKNPKAKKSYRREYRRIKKLKGE